MTSLGKTISPAVVLITLLSMQGAWSQYGGTSTGCPRFQLRDGTEHFSGKCFAVNWNNRKLLFTTLHQLGSAGGMANETTQLQVNAVVDHVDVLDCSDNRVLGTASHDLLTNDLGSNWNRGNLPGDMVVFELAPSSSLTPLSLSPTLAPVGTRVWVLSHDDRSGPGQTDRYSGAIIQSTTAFITVKLDQSLVALASSGSPVVNQRNEVVGMMIGIQNPARTAITAIPSTGIAARLAAEVRR